ncbi:MAG: hypothetical protein N2383_14280, partial [Caldilineales bacterium]|nr:hypothetical protein [Caldilineales bacterium]
MSPSASSRRPVLVLVVIGLVLLMVGLSAALVWRWWRLPPAPVSPTPTATAPMTPTPTRPISPSPTPTAPEPIVQVILGSLVPGVYEAYDHRNTGAELRGGMIEFRWNQVEPTRNGYNWIAIDQALAQMPTGKRAILRLLIRCNSGNNEICTPTWALADEFNPIVASAPAACGFGASLQKHLNYLDEGIQRELLELIRLLGRRYNGDARIGGIEVGIGYNGEASPWPMTGLCDKEAQNNAYVAAYGESGPRLWT